MVKTKQNRPIYNVIIEQTTVVPASQLEMLSETTTSSGHKKAIFRSKLQEHSVTNKNGRVYPKVVCENIVSQLSTKARTRNMFMEVDHPMFFEGSGDPEMMKRRAAVIELKNCGAVCRNIAMKDNYIIGEIETLSGFKGPDVANILINDGVDIGFSLRALGGVQKLDNGLLEVQHNIMPITYDFVTNPSHSNAKIMEFLPENDCGILNDGDSILFEGHELELLKEDNIEVNKFNYGKKFIDDILIENFKIVSRKVQFLF